MGITMNCKERDSVEFKFTSDIKYIDHSCVKKVAADFLVERSLALENKQLKTSGQVTRADFK